MIIIEGPDRCGKTTIARALRDLLPGWAYRHHTKPTENPFAYYARFLVGANPRHIVDRMYWSEYAYGDVLRGACGLTQHELRLLELSCLSLSATTVFVTDTPESIQKRSPGTSEAETVALCERFTQARGLTKVTELGPYTLPDLVDSKQRPTGELQRIAALEMGSANVGLFPSVGYGVIRGGFMVVAERPNISRIKSFHGLELPLCSGFSGDWFWRALDENHTQWWRGYYCNSTAFRTPKDFRGEVLQRQPEVILCLGLTAQALAKAAGVPYAEAPHPMHARRFHYSGFDEYRDTISQALGSFAEEVEP